MGNFKNKEQYLISLAKNMKEVIHLREFLKVLEFPSLANTAAERPIYHVDICHHFIRHSLKAKMINIKYPSTEEMLAELQTKSTHVFICWL